MEEAEEIHKQTTQHEDRDEAVEELKKHGLEEKHEVDFMQPDMTIEESIMSSMGPTQGLSEVRQHLLARKRALKERNENDRD